MSSDKHQFSIVDIVVFAGFMLLATGLGLYASLRKRRQHTNDTADFLMGGRDMPILPTAMSLFSSLISGIALLSLPAEYYVMGTCYLFSVMGNIAALLFTAYFFLPVFFQVKSVNLYQFIDDRFGSGMLRTYSCILFTMSTLVYMSVVLFAPSTALSAITDLSTPALIVGLGLLATVYTSIGGLRAVVWTDAFQTVVMFIGCIVLVIKGSISVGGPAKVFVTAKEGGRLDVNFDANPFQYMTFWTATFGGFFYWLSAWGSNQMSLQRSRQLAVLVIPFMVFVNGLVFYYGLVMYTYYKDCDPLKTKSVTSKDQLTIYFMIEMLSSIPGFSGIFLACLFSGTLSTLSSGINSMASVAQEEFVRPAFGHRLDDERKATLASKVVSVFYGLITIALAFAAEPMGGVVNAVTAGLGALATPVLGVIFLGVLVPWAEKRGAFIGIVSGSAMALWLFLGQVIQKPVRAKLYTSTDGCPAPNFTTGNTMQSSSFYTTDSPILASSSAASPEAGTVNIYGLSVFMFSVIGCVVTVVVGAAASIILINAAFAKRPNRCQRQLVFWNARSQGQHDSSSNLEMDVTEEYAIKQSEVELVLTLDMQNENIKM